MRTRRALERIDTRLGDLLEELRKQHELDRELSRREHEQTRAAIHNVQQVNRAMLLELRDHRTILERIDHGVQANTQGLMHVLDELRNGRGGPGTAPAT
jgi:chromosome segregation ATPase